MPRFFNAIEDGYNKGLEYGTYASKGIFGFGVLTIAASMLYAERINNKPGNADFLIGVIIGMTAMIYSESVIPSCAVAGATIAGVSAAITEISEYMKPQAGTTRHK